MSAPAHLPVDTRNEQCARAADYMEAHPGCTLRELDRAADLGSASKVISEMKKRGYQIRTKRGQVAIRDGSHSRRIKHYWLISRPKQPQQELFPTE
jgi:Helix-turn-helix domain